MEKWLDRSKDQYVRNLKISIMDLIFLEVIQTMEEVKLWVKIKNKLERNRK